MTARVAGGLCTCLRMKGTPPLTVSPCAPAPVGMNVQILFVRLCGLWGTLRSQDHHQGLMQFALICGGPVPPGQLGRRVPFDAVMRGRALAHGVNRAL